MKIRWRQHETALCSMVTVILLAKYVWEAIKLITVKTLPGSNTFTFSRVLLPQLWTVMFLLVCYSWVNKLFVTLFSQKWSYLKVVKAIVLLLVISYLIGPVNNFASFYINPGYTGGPVTAPFVFGFHPQPFNNLFGGWDVAIFMVLLISAYMLLRELVRLIITGGPDSAYKVQICNEITLLLTVLLTYAAFASVFDMAGNLRYFYAFTLPAGAIFITNKYSLFPAKGSRRFSNWQVYAPILIVSFTYTLIFSIALGSEWTVTRLIINWMFQVFVITTISWLNYQQNADKINELRGAKTAMNKSKADLQLLRMQINPHFLFNILNTLYGTALIEGAKNAAEGIQKLGDMMRFMLHENMHDQIPVAKEIDYLNNYISLQKLRTQLSADIIIEHHIAAGDCNYNIAPMLLIPLIENAFKHGINLSSRSWIKINLECADHRLNFMVQNSVHPTAANDPEKENSGIGLQNVASRLQLLYPGKHSFTYGLQDDGFTANLTLTL